MSSHSQPGIDLTSTQQMVLQELVSRYRASEKPVKGEAVADGVDRTPGTIRNQMQSLKALQLVEGIPGPQGGYKPTSRAYDALSLQDVSEPETVPLAHNGESVGDAVVETINLISVLHPENCRAEVTLQGGVVGAFEEGDAVAVGPTPLSGLRVDGVVEGIDDVNSTLVLTIESMDAPAEAP